MESSTFLGIIGIIATIVFGVLGFVFFRRTKNPGKITLVKQSVIGLFNNIAKNFEEISIKYKGEPIKENIIYLKASFINDGDIDIDGNRVEKSLTLNLKEGLKWIKAEVTNKSSGLNCRNQKNPSQQVLEFNFGLFRKKEFFQFEVLIESDNSDIKAEDIYDHITINHRIANTQKIKHTSVSDTTSAKKKMKNFRQEALAYSTVFIILISGLIFGSQLLSLKTLLHYRTPGGKLYKIYDMRPGEVVLREVFTDEELTSTIYEFYDSDNYISELTELTVWDAMDYYKTSKYVISIFFFISLWFISVLYWDYFKIRKSNKFANIIHNKE